MSNKNPAIFFRNYIEQIRFPSNSMQTPAGDGSEQPKTPLETIALTTAERAYAIHLGLKKNMRIESIPEAIRKDAKLPTDELKENLTRQYGRFQRERHFPTDFSPADAVAALETSVNQVIQDVGKSVGAVVDRR